LREIALRGAVVRTVVFAGLRPDAGGEAVRVVRFRLVDGFFGRDLDVLALRLPDEAVLRVADRPAPLDVWLRRFAAFRAALLPAVCFLRNDAAEAPLAPVFADPALRPARRALGPPVFRLAIPPPRLP
jgi:hypothetical protein